MNTDRTENKRILGKIPLLMQERLLSMINKYFACKDREERKSMVIDIEFHIMRFWQRGYITPAECCVMLKDLD